MDTLKFDFVVIGSGLAGSAAAYLLSQYGEVALLSKEPPNFSNSNAAQGGIAAAMSQTDSPTLHVQDTLYAGDGLCDEEVVNQLVSNAADYMKWLMEVGVIFDRNRENMLSLGLEGAHSRPRVLHAGGDATGANVLKVLTERIQENPRIWTCYEAHVQSLIQVEGTVHGAIIASNKTPKMILGNKATILATGGVGQLFAATTNPLGATGDGIALAYEAGAIIKNLEFIQFHPTAMQMDSNPKFLISEAVRGAGGILIDSDEKRIMADHPLKDLAPRDQVARRIFQVQQEGKQVYLDGTKIDVFESRFPTIYKNCLANGIDPKSQTIPVTPAAHFVMGGIMAGLNGQTNLPGLYALGEVACTGVHGANRLASNSMLECIGMAHEMVEHLRHCEPIRKQSLDMFDENAYAMMEKEHPDVLKNVQQIMWEAAGIVRTHTSLDDGLQQLRALKAENPHSLVLTTAILIVQSALSRTESRGAHFRSDYPNHDDAFAHDTTIGKKTDEMAFVL